MSVQILAQRVAAGGGMPDVCARHGEPADSRLTIRLVSRPPLWAYPLAILGLVVFIVVMFAVRKTVTAVAWPFCARCRRWRSRAILASIALLLVGVVGFFGGASMAGAGSAAGGLVMLLGLICLLAGLIGVTRSTPPAVAGAEVSRDGRFVVVRTADERFATQAVALTARPAAASASDGTARC